MSVSRSERRTYNLPALALFGACLTALGHMQAAIERQDTERGHIVAAVGGGVLAVVVRPLGDGATALEVEWRGRGRRALATFLETVERLVGAA
jgi:hypothetical protein